MIAAGIIDPFKVVKNGLVDASGVASLLATTECAIVDAPQPKVHQLLHQLQVWEVCQVCSR